MSFGRCDKIFSPISGKFFHNFYQANDFLRRWLIRHLLGLSTRVIILSEKWKPFFASIITEEKIEVLPNSIRADEYYTDNFPYKRYLAQKKSILFMGTLSREKGVYDIIRAIPIIRNKVKDIVFIFAGEAESLNEAKRLVNLCREGINEEYICLLGTFTGKKKVDLLLASDIFVLPSYSEGLPFVILEAMAAGLPIISTEAGAIPEVVVDGENGFIIKPGDYVEMAERIYMLLQDRALCSEFGNNNRKRVMKYYNLDVMIKRLDYIYNELI